MTETGTAIEILQTYYDALAGGIESFEPDRLRQILAADLAFDGPIAGQRVGAEPFIKGVSGFIETARGLKLQDQLHDGDRAATLYDAELPGGTVRFAEFFHIKNGKIQSLRLLYDATEYRARGGR